MTIKELFAKAGHPILEGYEIGLLGSSLQLVKDGEFTHDFNRTGKWSERVWPLIADHCQILTNEPVERWALVIPNKIMEANK